VSGGGVRVSDVTGGMTSQGMMSRGMTSRGNDITGWRHEGWGIWRHGGWRHEGVGDVTSRGGFDVTRESTLML